MVRIVSVSDTHNWRIKIPDGDILVHGGDFTKWGTAKEIILFNEWLGDLPHKHRLVIAGNHDGYFQSHPSKARALLTNATYLQDSGVRIEGLNFYGSPWVPKFGDWWFGLERGKKLAKKWALIPDNTDVLITHAPPYGILDEIKKGEHIGCEELKKRVLEINPRLHIFGHIHPSAGIKQVGDTKFINASICAGHNTNTLKPKHHAIIIDL